MQPALHISGGYASQADTVTYLTFRLGENVFGAKMDQVQEIVRFAATSPVPLTPAWIRGVFSLRGRVLPAIDLAVRLGLSARAVSSRTCILMLDMDVGGLHFSSGIIVDEVKDIVELTPTEIEPAPTFGVGIKVEFLQGIIQRDGQSLLLLDVVRVFQEDELLQLALTEQRLRNESEERLSAKKASSLASRLQPANEPSEVIAGEILSSNDTGVHFFDDEE